MSRVRYSVPARLLTPEGRRRSVLVLRGMGLNIWHYYPLLRRFTLEELNEFARIYAASGGAVVLWLYCLAQQSAFVERRAADFDARMRRCMNQRSLAARCWRFLWNKHLYTADDNLTLIRELVSEAAAAQTFENHPLKNVSVLAQEEVQNDLVIIRPETNGDWNVSSVLSLVVTTSTGFGRKLCRREPYRGYQLADFEFSSDTVRQRFRETLSHSHPDEDVYHINIYRERCDGRVHFVKASGDRWPRLAQAIDFVRFFAGLPNRRYLTTFMGTTLP